MLDIIQAIVEIVHHKGGQVHHIAVVHGQIVAIHHLKLRQIVHYQVN